MGTVDFDEQEQLASLGRDRLHSMAIAMAFRYQSTRSDYETLYSFGSVEPMSYAAFFANAATADGDVLREAIEKAFEKNRYTSTYDYVSAVERAFRELKGRYDERAKE